MADSGFVLIGGGLASAAAAQTLREGDPDSPITVLTDEPELPYERPPLSKGYLLGKADRGSVFVHDQPWYDEQRIEVRTSTQVTGLDPAGRAVLLADGSTVGYRAALLATGSHHPQLPVPGADRPEVFGLRKLAQSDALKAALARATNVVVVGAGWIGLEGAAAARTLGKEVAVVETAELPLAGVLGPQVGSLFADLHARHGVRFHFGAQVAGIDDAGVSLQDGTVLPADLVLVGIGARPLTGLAEAAGLKVDNGVLVDSLLRTSAEGLWAAGDVMNAEHPLLGRRIRVEHWANALNSGKAAGRSMLGAGQPYDRVPYFFSDQFDLGMEYSGFVADTAAARVVFRGDPASGEYLAFWLDDDRVQAGMNVNVWDVTDPIQALVRAGWAGRSVDVGRLSDPDVPLDELL